MTPITPSPGTEASFLGRPLARDATQPPGHAGPLTFSTDRPHRSVRYDGACPGWDEARRRVLARELKQAAWEKLRLCAPGRRVMVSSSRAGVNVTWSGLSLDDSVALVVALDRVYAQIMGGDADAA